MWARRGVCQEAEQRRRVGRAATEGIGLQDRGEEEGGGGAHGKRGRGKSTAWGRA